jgi:NAD(P)-dependent dehydrogenase (short-subunit alcohol dehydrogenase family)
MVGAVFPDTALVTGGASGIGAALVAVLERDGVDVRVLDLRDGFDVADPRAWDEVGPVDLACLNAGVTTGEDEITAVSEDAYRRILAANVDGVVFGTRRLAAVMKPGSAIVATASLAGLVPLAADPCYSLTKHAVVGFVRSVAPQLERRGIRICAVAPGVADTPLIAGTRELYEKAGFPLLRPEDVAMAVLRVGREGDAGEVWVVQPGREPEPFRFPNVPGPRDEAGRPVGPPPDRQHNASV